MLLRPYWVLMPVYMYLRAAGQCDGTAGRVAGWVGSHSGLEGVEPSPAPAPRPRPAQASAHLLHGSVGGCRHHHAREHHLQRF